MAFGRIHYFMLSSAYHKSGGRFRCHLNRVPTRIHLGSTLERWRENIPTVLLLLRAPFIDLINFYFVYKA